MSGLMDSWQPMVSVRLFTYNQEAYIGQAIESILAQETDFDFEIVMGDDFSPDRTVEIARSYEARFPGKFNILAREGKLGRLKNFADILQNCRGKYIAFLDGDDAWDDPLKLQKQVDFLEAHPDYVICHHNAVEIDENGTIVKESILPEGMKTDFTGDELVRLSMVLTSTPCFRNVEVLKDLPPEFYKVSNADTFVYSLLGHYGKSRYMGNEINPSLYRVHSGGVWSLSDEWKKRFRKSGSYYWMSRYYRRVGLAAYEEGYQYKFLSCYFKLARHLVRGNLPKFQTLRQYVFSDPKKYLDFRFIFGLVKVLGKRGQGFLAKRFFTGRIRVEAEG